MARKPQWRLWLKYLYSMTGSPDTVDLHSSHNLDKTNLFPKASCCAAMRPYGKCLFFVFNSGKFLVDKISCGQLTQMPLEMHWRVVVNRRQSELNLLIIDSDQFIEFHHVSGDKACHYEFFIWLPYRNLLQQLTVYDHVQISFDIEKSRNYGWEREILPVCTT